MFLLDDAIKMDNNEGAIPCSNNKKFPVRTSQENNNKNNFINPKVRFNWMTSCSPRSVERGAWP